MANIYTDGNGGYYAPGNVNALQPTMTDVNMRTAAYYTTVQMLTTSLPLAGWTPAPGLSDIGGGVWALGILADPSGQG